MKRVGIALGWLFLFAVLAVGVVILVAGLVPNLGGPAWFVARNGAYMALGFGVATLVVGRLLNKYSWERMGWTRGPRFGRGVELLRGTAIGAVMAVLAIGLAVVFGARLQLTGDWSVWAGIALPLIIGLVIAALAEELGFRGYPLRRLSDAIGVLPALLLGAIAFGLVHIGNPSASVFGTVNVVLAGVWLSIAFFSAGGMSLAWGAHFGWNAGLALLFDAPVSGFRFQVPAVEYTPGAQSWIDGGAFGPEGGIVSTVALIAGMLWLLTRPAAFAQASDSVPPLSQGEGIRG
ncbi:MAG TPA: type II CAAX endopeptidase family protein [Gemmatimonadales bacterium]|nr:type II CAAX endopeptidase family protein [Gemmatimonadales bacterium]